MTLHNLLPPGFGLGPGCTRPWDPCGCSLGFRKSAHVAMQYALAPQSSSMGSHSGQKDLLHMCMNLFSSVTEVRPSKVQRLLPSCPPQRPDTLNPKPQRSELAHGLLKVCLTSASITIADQYGSSPTLSGPQYRPKNIRIPMLGTPIRYPYFGGNDHILPFQAIIRLPSFPSHDSL